MMTEEVIEVAQDWRRVKLKDVAEKPQYGITASAAKAGAVKFLRITDISDQGVDWDTVPYCEASSDAIRSCLLREGDVVFARIGATTGKSYLIKDPPNAVFASYLIRVRARKGLDPVFLSHFFKSDGYWEQIDANKHANLKKGVNGSILSELEVPLPPLPEQQRIAQVLSTVQEAIAQQERLIRTTTELKQALMQKLFTEGLRGEALKETEIGRVPESWEVVKLGSLGHVGNGSTPKRTENGYWDGGTNPWLNSTKIHERFIEHADQFVTERAMKECHLPIVPANSLMIAITGQGKTLGNVALTRIDATINQHLAYVRFSNTQVEPEFLMWYLSTQYDQLRSVAHGAGSTKGALTCSYLKSLLVPMPSLNEQRGITDVLSKLEDKARTADRKRNALQDLFRTLLHELMTGKVRVGQAMLA